MPQLNETINIDYDAVQGMANNFKNTSEVMNSIAQIMEAAINILKVSALLGSPGDAALAHYLEGIKPNLQRVAATCLEMSTDLEASVTAFQEGDVSGSTKFNR